MDFPQSRGDDARLHRNLILAFAACGSKCPVKLCGYRMAARPGNAQEQNLEREGAGHLLRLTDARQAREDYIFDHWEQHHCPAATVATVKTSCPHFDANGQGCSRMVFPQVFDLKRHLKQVHKVTDYSLSKYHIIY